MTKRGREDKVFELQLSNEELHSICSKLLDKFPLDSFKQNTVLRYHQRHTKLTKYIIIQVFYTMRREAAYREMLLLDSSAFGQQRYWR